MGQPIIQITRYWLSDHPSIVNFRWSQSWGSTWSFLFTSISIYVVAAATLHLLLILLRGRKRPVVLGPIPAIHSLSMALISAVIFVGILLSSAVEIRDIRWLLRRTKTTTFQWLLCFPPGTRSSGRVFFWSYIFYLSRFLHLLRTFLTVLRRRRLTFFHIFNQSILILTSFLWLEFSQSFQVIAILLNTLLYCVVYGYRLWINLGFPAAAFPLMVNCQVGFLGCNLVCHFGVIFLHLLKGGCNGIGAFLCSSVLNAAFLCFSLKFYMKMRLGSAWPVSNSGIFDGGDKDR